MKPLAERPLPERAVFLATVIGMIKDAGYKTPEHFIGELQAVWPSVKERDTFSGDERND